MIFWINKLDAFRDKYTKLKCKYEENDYKENSQPEIEKEEDEDNNEEAEEESEAENDKDDNWNIDLLNLGDNSDNNNESIKKNNIKQKKEKKENKKEKNEEEEQQENKGIKRLIAPPSGARKLGTTQKEDENIKAKKDLIEDLLDFN